MVATVTRTPRVPPAVKVTVVVLRLVVGPLGTIGDTDVENVTVPANPLRLVALMVELSDLLCNICRVAGVAVRLKSCIVTTAMTLTERAKFVAGFVWSRPVAVTVTL